MSLIGKSGSRSESEVMTAMGDKIKLTSEKIQTTTGETRKAEVRKPKPEAAKADNRESFEGMRIDGITVDGITLDVHGDDSSMLRPVRFAAVEQDRFSTTELAALRQDLLQAGMADSWDAAQLLQVFLTGRGYGVSPAAALDAAGRVEMSGCAMPVLQHELENLALVM